MQNLLLNAGKIAISAVLAATFFSISPAFSVGDSDSTTIITPKCKRGKVWSKKKRKCILIKKSSQLDDENLYQAGRDLAALGRYDDAIMVLSNSRNMKDPRVLNYLGYSHRKAGRIDIGLGYYMAALKIDPDYTLVREYLGEAYLQLNDLDKARDQLTEIEIRCGTHCKEYGELASLIRQYQAN